MILLAMKLLLFLAVTVSFGYIASRLLLKEAKISILVPFSILIGLEGYLFLVNAFSYFVPITESIWLVLGAFVAFVAYQLYRKGVEWFTPELDFSRRELKILFGLALLISLMSGIVQLRALDPDDYSHLIFAATIGAGNFPVMNPMDPDTMLSYHYGPDLLAAATHTVTGIPFLQDYDLQTFLFSGITFLLAFLVAFAISESFFTSVVAALFFFFGAGALYLNITHGFSPLYQRYVLHENVVGQWKFLADMLWPKINHFYTYAIRDHTSIAGTPLLLAVTYLYFKCISIGRTRVKDGVLVGVFLGALALSLETSFVIVSTVLVTALAWRIYRAVISVAPAERERYWASVRFIAILLFVGAAIASVQGGILTATLRSGAQSSGEQTFAASGHQSFAFNQHPTRLVVSADPKDAIPLSSTTFLKEFGLLLILFPIAVFFFRRDKKVLFLSVIGTLAFLIPILVVYVSRPWELTRIFAVATTFFALVSGLLIGTLVETYKENVKVKGALLSVSLLVIGGGLAFQLVCMVTPFSNFGKLHVPLVAMLPQPSSLDAQMYAWIRAHTNNSSRFFPYSPTLMIETGRMSPGNYPTLFPEGKIPVYAAVSDTCGRASIDALGLEYLVVSSDGFTREEYRAKCAKLAARLVFSAEEGLAYRDIFEVEK